MKKLIILAALILVASCYSNQKERQVKRFVENTYKESKVTWIRNDSCYSVTRPLISLQYLSVKANTKEEISDVYDKVMQLSDQLHDHFTDYGGLKLSCYIVGYTTDNKSDSAIIIVEPSGELITEVDEYDAWFKALDEVSEKLNFIYSMQ